MKSLRGEETETKEIRKLCQTKLKAFQQIEMRNSLVLEDWKLSFLFNFLASFQIKFSFQAKHVLRLANYEMKMLLRSLMLSCLQYRFCSIFAQYENFCTILNS